MPTGFPDYYGGLTLPVTVQEGGTGLTTVTTGALLIGEGNATMHVLAPGTAGLALLSNGAGADPSWGNPTVDVSQITGILAIAHGGTGTATPALVAGTGISLSGSWPNETITNSSNYATLADPLPVAHGGTGTATPALVAGANIAISGSWPNQTVALAADVSTRSITLTGGIDFPLTVELASVHKAYFSDNGQGNGIIFNADGADFMGIETFGDGTTSRISLGHTTTQDTNITEDLKVFQSGVVTIPGSLTLGTPLAVAQGGTGTATPALVAGAGISLSGTWPNETIAVTNPPPVIAKVDLTGKNANIAATQIGATPAADGLYRLSAYVVLTTVDPASSTLPNVNAIYTDADSGAAETIAVTGNSTSNILGQVGPIAGSTLQSNPFYFKAKSGVPIKYSTTGYASGTLGTMKYAVHLLLEGPF